MNTLPDTSSTATVPPLPPLTAQAEHLIGLGVHELAGMPADELHAFAEDAGSRHGDALLAVHPDRVPASVLAPLLRHDGKPGFVVTDMPDVDRFVPCTVELPDAPLYLVTGLDRGDHMATGAGRGAARLHRGGPHPTAAHRRHPLGAPATGGR